MNLDLNLRPFEELLHGSATSHQARQLPPPAGGGGGGGGDDNGVELSFFDCNICYDIAADPVVTCCGHLFCWPCIYRWLFVHSRAKQCPVCKGDVTVKTVTPIYSRVNRSSVTNVANPNLGFEIPSRPVANRVESWRHSFQRDLQNLPIIEMVRRADNNRGYLSRDPLSNNPEEIPTSLLLNRIFTSRGMRTGHDSVTVTPPPDVTVYLEEEDDHVSDLASAESFVDSYFRDNPDEGNQEELPWIDRDLIVSAADFLQTEIAGLRRGRDPSTSAVVDVDSGNSRAMRRRLR